MYTHGVYHQSLAVPNIFSIIAHNLKIFTKLEPSVYSSLDPYPIPSSPDPEFVLPFHVSFMFHIQNIQRYVFIPLTYLSVVAHNIKKNNRYS